MSSLAVPVAPRTGKIIKNVLRVFEEEGENLLKNSILDLHSFKFSQSSEIVLQS